MERSLLILGLAIYIIGCGRNGMQSMNAKSDLIFEAEGMGRLILTDSNSGSSRETTSTAVSVSVVAQKARAYCLTETKQSPGSICRGGQGSQNGWHETVPRSFVLSSGAGTKTVHLYILGRFGRYYANSTQIQLVEASPTPTATPTPMPATPTPAPTAMPTPPPTPASGTFRFDSSEYRQNTYGAPTHYCNPTRALNDSGTGTLANPWNIIQCMQLAVAGNVVGIMPGIANIPTTNNGRFPAFRPTNSGTETNRIIFVTKFAAVALSNVEANANRTEIRHDGTRARATGDTEVGTGCPAFGSYFSNYVTFDGFYVDMATAQPKTDSGVIRAEFTTGIHFKNFEIKGTMTNLQSNPVIYRPQGSRDTILSNFRAYDFSNDTSGSNVPQQALFSDQYGDENVLMEHFEIRNTQRGIFFKGSSMAALNYGTIRYGVVSNVSSCYQFNALDSNPSHMTYVHNNICHDLTYGGGIRLSSETVGARNIMIYNNTIAKGNSAINNFEGCIMTRASGIATNVTIRDNLCDMDNGPFGHGVAFGENNTLPDILNYNAYYKNGSNITFAFNGVQYNTFASWQAATGRDARSQILTSTPFVNRAGNDFRVPAGHPAKTASSTGGEVGAWAGTEVPGVIGE